MRRFLAPVTAASLAMMTAASPGAAYEEAQDGSAANYLGAAVQGPGYTVEPVVPSDGFVRRFTVETDHGRLQVDGVALMRQRVNELAALHHLERMSQSDVFTKSLGEAALAPVKFGAALVKDPGRTINQTVSGIGNMFNRIGASRDNKKADRDRIDSSLLGIAAARRQLAVELGIDPYTDFQPLANKLEEVARASALGGLSVRVALSVIPGAGGMIVSSGSTASSIKDTLRDKTAAQILQQVRGTLQGLKVRAGSVAALTENRHYTPADLLIMSRALARLKAGGTDLFVMRAALANSRDLAFFQRQRAELLAAGSKDLGGIAEFISVEGFPLNRTRDGTVVALFPLDDLAWTETAAQAVTTITAALRSAGYQQAPVLATSASVTPMAAAELEKLGWAIVALR